MGFSSEDLMKEEEAKLGKDVLPKGSSLEEVLAGKNSYLFVEHLKAKKKSVLAKKITTGVALKESDLDLLADEVQEFSEKIILVNEAQALLTKESMLGFALNNPEFKGIVKILGEANALSIIKRKLGEIAFSDVPRFDAISNSLKDYTKGTEEVKKNNIKIDELLKKNNVDSAEFVAKVLKETDPLKQAAALNELASRGLKEKKDHWYSLGKKVGFNNKIWTDLVDAKGLHEASLLRLRTEKGNVGGTLGDLKGNKEMRDVISRKLRGIEEPDEEKLGLRETMEEKKPVDPKEIAKLWEDKKKSTAGYARLAPANKIAARDAFIADQKIEYAKANKKDGWLASLIEAFVEAIREKQIDDEGNKLKI